MKKKDKNLPAAVLQSGDHKFSWIKDIKSMTNGELIELYAYAEAIVETVREPLIILDKNLIVKTANKSFFDLFKMSKRETYGKHIYELNGGEWNVPELKKLLEEILPQNTFFNDFEVRHNFDRLGQKIMLLNARRIVLEENKTQLILLAIEDITIRTQTEIELQARLHQQKAVTKLGLKALEGTSITDFMQLVTTTIVETLDCDLSKILEILPDKNELIFSAGSGWKKGVIGNTKISAAKDDLGGFTLHKKKPVIFYNLLKEKRFTSPKVHYDHGILSGIHVVIQGASGESPFGILGACSTTLRHFTQDDSTFLQSIANIISQCIERKRIDERKDDFLSIASHELKTPITSIKAYSQILEKRYHEKNEEKNAYFVSNINTQADKISSLIRDLLDVGKIEAGKMKFKKQTFNLDAILQKIVVDFEYSTEHHKIIITNSVKTMIVGDPDRIGQVVINLLTNAIKYSPKGSDILVRSHIHNDTATVSIQDFGIGISDSKQQHVFKKYFQVTEKGEEGKKGFGLGLYIIAEIIKRHKGKIWVESKKGKGSIFYFSLPIHKTLLTDV